MFGGTLDFVGMYYKYPPATSSIIEEMDFYEYYCYCKLCKYVM